ncbi:hypothetical protein [Klebsiella pneumoniae]|uniref:hypothetical protein n=1 Tax=Klebsiella pneumoniae TaxID=573 RepID=UPI003D80AB0E
MTWASVFLTKPGKSAKKDKDPVNKSGGKAKKKKWSKGKVRDKLNNLVLVRQSDIRQAL